MKVNIVVDAPDAFIEVHPKEGGLWNFVAMFYPGYSSSGDVAESDVLQRIVDGEYEQDEDDTAWTTFRDEYDLQIDRVEEALHHCNADIYERTLETFIQSIIKVEKV